MGDKTFKGILGVTSKIEGFTFDERKFLNGLTEKEFRKITDNIGSEKDFKNAPVEYREIIIELKRQQKSWGVCPSYHGKTERVIFSLEAAVIEYDAVFKRLAGKYKELEIPESDSRLIVHLLDINLGKTELRTPPYPQGIGYSGKLLVRNINTLPFVSEKLLKALFQSVDHTFCDIGHKPAYEITPAIHEATPGPYVKNSSFTLEGKIGKTIKRGHVTVDTLKFIVDGSIQYRFTPSLGEYEELDKFGLTSTIVTREDRNMMS